MLSDMKFPNPLELSAIAFPPKTPLPSGAVRLASVPWIVRYCRASANFASRCDRKKAGRGVVVLQDVLLAHIVRGEDGDEWSRRSRLLHIGTSSCLLALDQAHHTNNIET